MNAMEITRANIASLGGFNLGIGKSAGNKGTEVYQFKHTLARFWITDADREEQAQALRAKIEGKDLDTLFVSEISLNDGTSMKCSNNIDSYRLLVKNHSLSKLLKSGLQNVKVIHIQEAPELIGYLSLSKYKATKESQLELYSDTLSLLGYSTSGEIEDSEWDLYDDVKDFDRYDARSDKYYTGDYVSVHGGNSYAEKEEDCLHFDGKCSPCNNDVLNDFWDNQDESWDWLKELDPEDELSLYHRKGKDFYISYRLETIDTLLQWRDEGETECDESNFYALVYRENLEKIKAFEDALKSLKDDIEAKSYVHDEIEGGAYADGIFSQDVLSLVFEDKNDAARYIIESINFENDIKDECRKISIELNTKRFVIRDDYTINVLTLDYVGNEKAVSYNELKLLKRLANKAGCELVYSRIGNTDNLGFAIKQSDEEYHFTMEELLLIEDGMNPAEFLQECLNSIALRKITQMNEDKLLEKAKTIFLSVQDSYNAGNCKAGTSAFLARHHIDTSIIGGIRGDYLLEMETSMFTKNMVVRKLLAQNAA